MGVEDLVSPAVVAEFENRYMAVRRSAGEQASDFMRSPRNHVNGSGMKGEVEDFRPGAAANRGSGALVLFAPDEHFAVVG